MRSRGARDGPDTGKPPAEGIVLAFDLGTTRTGVAIGNCVTRKAQGLRTVRHGRQDAAEAVSGLVRDWGPQALVVGHPLDADGGPQPMTRRAERFARSLAERFGLRTFLVDERHTSAVARAQAGRDQVDAKAAEIILQDWLDGAPHTPVQGPGTPPAG